MINPMDPRRDGGSDRGRSALWHGAIFPGDPAVSSNVEDCLQGWIGTCADYLSDWIGPRADCL